MANAKRKNIDNGTSNDGAVHDDDDVVSTHVSMMSAVCFKNVLYAADRIYDDECRE